MDKVMMHPKHAIVLALFGAARTEQHQSDQRERMERPGHGAGLAPA